MLASSFTQNICMFTTAMSITIMLGDGEDGVMRKIVNPYKNAILAEILCKCAIQGVHLMAITD